MAEFVNSMFIDLMIARNYDEETGADTAEKVKKICAFIKSCDRSQVIIPGDGGLRPVMKAHLRGGKSIVENEH